MSESAGSSLTLAEAVPLGAVAVQRLLASEGVRSLAYKGPAFVALGVRRPKISSDIDLFVHPQDRQTATTVLLEAGWSIISHWFPPAMDDVIYSTTFRHPMLPSPLDLHHKVSGLLAGPAVFDVLWEERTIVTVASQPLVTTSLEHALVLEALNRLKTTRPERWDGVARSLVDASREVGLDDVITAADGVGARHTAAPLISALEGAPPSQPAPRGYDRWCKEAGAPNNRTVVAHLLRKAPAQIPRVLWHQLTLREDIARFWAESHDVEFRSRYQVLSLRLKRLALK